VIALTLQRIVHDFGDVRAVDDLSLDVHAGEVVCLVGPSGCGKTTALRIAAGLEPVQRGRVLIDGKVVADGATGRSDPPNERSVGLMFQDFALFPHLSVRDNVTFGLRHLAPKARERRAMDMLAQVGMAQRADAFPHTLSGGQQQRVALARALAPEPQVMLLDEPFSGLDANLRREVRDQTLHVLKDSGTAALLVTHDPEEAMFMADRIAVMNDGRIEQMGTPEAIFFHPNNPFVASFFGEVNRVDGTVRGGEVETPFGGIDANGLEEGAAVDVLIRPEGLIVRRADGAPSAYGGRVITVRQLGRSSLVHLCVDGRPRGAHLHVHSRMPGRIRLATDDRVEIAVDPDHAFVFPHSADQNSDS